MSLPIETVLTVLESHPYHHANIFPRRTTMKVLIVNDTYPPDVNGAAYFTKRLAEGLDQRGHEVHVLCTSTGPRSEVSNLRRGEATASDVFSPPHKRRYASGYARPDSFPASASLYGDFPLQGFRWTRLDPRGVMVAVMVKTMVEFGARAAAALACILRILASPPSARRRAGEGVRLGRDRGREGLGGVRRGGPGGPGRRPRVARRREEPAKRRAAHHEMGPPAKPEAAPARIHAC